MGNCLVKNTLAPMVSDSRINAPFARPASCRRQHIVLPFLEINNINASSFGGGSEMAREIKKAVAYLRTSSAANVGADKDSAQRQRAAIAAFAKR